MPGIDGQPRFGVTRGPASTIVGWASVTDVAGVGDLIDSSGMKLASWDPGPAEG
jgi:hypothetical protein